MKKTLLLFFSFVVLTGAYASDGPVVGYKYHKKSSFNYSRGITGNDKPMVSNGFYLAFNLAFPSLSGGTSLSYGTLGNLSNRSLGTSIGLEIGNQWMFYKNETWGIGLNVTWLRFGYSSYKVDNLVKYGNLGLSFLELGPMFSYAISEKMAFDAYFNVCPFSMYAGLAGSNSGNAQGYFAASAFTRFVPGVRFRYDKFMVGFEPTFGSMAYAYGNSSGGTKTSYRVANFAPTILLGFKF